jgi:hypothetical protein
MPKIDYEKYLVRKPLYEAFGGTKNRQSPTMTMLSSKQVPGCNYYMEPGWIYGIPDPNPSLHEHIHDFDEIVMHMGGDYRTPQVLGGEVEFYVGGQPITFNTSATFYIPKGTPHGPVIWKKFQFPHLQMAIMCGTGSVADAWGTSGIHDEKNKLPVETNDFDYECFVVRSPVRDGGWESALTYMSEAQVPGVKYHIQYRWVTGDSESILPKAVRNNYDEILLHLGGDPDNPEVLGNEVEIMLGGQVLTFNTTSTLLLPQGHKHGHPKIKEFTRLPLLHPVVPC